MHTVLIRGVTRRRARSCAHAASGAPYSVGWYRPKVPRSVLLVSQGLRYGFSSACDHGTHGVILISSSSVCTVTCTDNMNDKAVYDYVHTFTMRMCMCMCMCMCACTCNVLNLLISTRAQKAHAQCHQAIRSRSTLNGGGITTIAPGGPAAATSWGLRN